MTDAGRTNAARGEVFLDARGRGRALQLTWHPEAELVVFSIWREGVCAGTFRLPRGDVGAFVDALVDGLRDIQVPREPTGDDPSAGGPGSATLTHTGQRDAFSDWAFGPTGADEQATAS